MGNTFGPNGFSMIWVTSIWRRKCWNRWSGWPRWFVVKRVVDVRPAR